MPASIRSVEQRLQAGRLHQEGAAHAEGGGREQRVLQQLQGGTLVAVGGDQGAQNAAVHPLANGAQHRGEGGERPAPPRRCRRRRGAAGRGRGRCAAWPVRAAWSGRRLLAAGRRCGAAVRPPPAALGRRGRPARFRSARSRPAGRCVRPPSRRCRRGGARSVRPRRVGRAVRVRRPRPRRPARASGRRRRARSGRATPRRARGRRRRPAPIPPSPLRLRAATAACASACAASRSPRSASSRANCAAAFRCGRSSPLHWVVSTAARRCFSAAAASPVHSSAVPALLRTSSGITSHPASPRPESVRGSSGTRRAAAASATRSPRVRAWPVSTRSRTTRRRSARGCGRSSTPAAAAATSSLTSRFEPR